MSEQDLQGPKIGTCLQQMRGEAVAKQMRRHALLDLSALCRELQRLAALPTVSLHSTDPGLGPGNCRYSPLGCSPCSFSAPSLPHHQTPLPCPQSLRPRVMQFGLCAALTCKGSEEYHSNGTLASDAARARASAVIPSAHGQFLPRTPPPSKSRKELAFLAAITAAGRQDFPSCTESEGGSGC